MMKENCNFDYFFNNSNVNPAVLDGGNEIMLANCSNVKCIECNKYNDIPLKFMVSHIFGLIEMYCVIIKLK